METSIVKQSRVGYKYMVVEKQGNLRATFSGICFKVGDMVWSMQKCIAVLTVKGLRPLMNITDEEGTHLKLFVNLWYSLKAENPELFTPTLLSECREIIHLAAQHEIVWGKYIISEGVMGLTESIITGFIESLADERLADIGLPSLYGTKNPIPWFKEASNINNGESNFFESKNASYVAGASLEWE